MTSTLKIDQTGLPAGAAGVSRTDGLATGALVTLTNTSATAASTSFKLLWTPPGDTSAISTLTQVSPGVWSFSPTPDVHGSYLVEMTENAGMSSERKERRIFGVRLPTSGLLIPALNEISDPRANISTPMLGASTELSDDNAVDYPNANLNQLPFAGWWRKIHELFLAIENGGGGGGGSPGGTNRAIQFNNSGTFGGSADLTFNSSVTEREIRVKSPASGTFAGVQFRDSANGVVGRVGYNETTSAVEIDSTGELTVTASGVDITTAADVTATIGGSLVASMTGAGLIESSADSLSLRGATALHLITNAVDWTWPTADGTAGQAITTNGLGVLGFSSVVNSVTESTDNVITVTPTGGTFDLSTPNIRFPNGNVGVGAGALAAAGVGMTDSVAVGAGALNVAVGGDGLIAIGDDAAKNMSGGGQLILVGASIAPLVTGAGDSILIHPGSSTAGGFPALTGLGGGLLIGAAGAFDSLATCTSSVGLSQGGFSGVTNAGSSLMLGCGADSVTALGSSVVIAVGGVVASGSPQFQNSVCVQSGTAILQNATNQTFDHCVFIGSELGDGVTAQTVTDVVLIGRGADVPSFAPLSGYIGLQNALCIKTSSNEATKFGIGSGARTALQTQRYFGRVSQNLSGFSADLNPVLGLVASGSTNSGEAGVFVGARDPNTFVLGNPGDLYVRTSGTTSSLYQNTGTAAGNTVWSRVGADPVVPPTIQNVTTVGPTAVTAADEVFVLVNYPSGSPSVVLPAHSAGRKAHVKDKSGGASGATKNITISSASGQIDGSATQVIATDYGSLSFVSDGTDWWIV